MKILLICNNISSSKDFISKKIVRDWEKAIVSDKRKANNSKTDGVLNDDNFKIISDKTQYNSFDFEKFAPEVVFIVPELLWERNGLNDGYGIALEVLSSKLKNRFFQLVFLSVIERMDIVKFAEKSYRNIIKAFPHFCLYDNFDLPIFCNQYSKVHFELIKSLAISNKGQIDVIDHDLSNVKNNLSSFNDNEIEIFKENIQPQLDELELLQAWTDIKIDYIRNNIQDAKDKESIYDVIASIEESVNEIRNNIQDENDPKPNIKSHYKVLIVEDEFKYRKFFVETFSELYKTVYPSSISEIEEFNISDSINLIKNNAKDYQVIILDLLYKDRNGFWLTFNGLDLYKLIKTKNQFTCVRIITSLPRDVVSKIMELTLNIKIPISHVFTKKVGFEALKYNIIDRVEEINLECKVNESLKSAYMPYPGEGVFSWPTIPDLMHSLTTNRTEKYEKCLNQTNHFFQLFKQDKLNQDTAEWDSGKLPSPKMEGKISESYFLKKLPIILTYRLIVLEETIKSHNKSVKSEYFIDAILSKICNIKTCDKHFLRKIGFSSRWKTDGSYFTIKFGRLFKEELDYIFERNNGKYNDSLKNFNNALYEWYLDILKETVVYENWDELKLHRSPYREPNNIEINGFVELSDINNNIMVEDLIFFFKSLIENLSNEYVKQIARIVFEESPINELLIKNIPEEIRTSTNLYFDSDM